METRTSLILSIIYLYLTTICKLLSIALYLINFNMGLEWGVNFQQHFINIWMNRCLGVYKNEPVLKETDVWPSPNTKLLTIEMILKCETCPLRVFIRDRIRPGL